MTAKAVAWIPASHPFFFPLVIQFPVSTVTQEGQELTAHAVGFLKKNA